MKKYNTPEIEALALETIDVIAASGGVVEPTGEKAADLMGKDGVTSTGAVTFTSNTWSW